MNPRPPKIKTVEEARASLESLASTLKGKYKKLARIVLDNPEFWKAPAAAGKHHNWPGGLCVHTAQVLQGALGLLKCVEGANISAVIVAALWHDYAKTVCYDLVETLDEKSGVTKTSYNNNRVSINVGHLPLSVSWLYSECIKLELPEYDTMFLMHLCLAHHGRLEWGSPVEPKCAEAWSIFASDYLSASFMINK